MPTGHRNTSFGFFGYFLMAVLVMLVWMVGWVQASLILPADAHTTPRQEHQSSAAEYRGIDQIELIRLKYCNLRHVRDNGRELKVHSLGTFNHITGLF
jgi:hypothetical protein